MGGTVRFAITAWLMLAWHQACRTVPLVSLLFRGCLPAADDLRRALAQHAGGCRCCVSTPGLSTAMLTFEQSTAAEDAFLEMIRGSSVGVSDLPSYAEKGRILYVMSTGRSRQRARVLAFFLDYGASALLPFLAHNSVNMVVTVRSLLEDLAADTDGRDETLLWLAAELAGVLDVGTLYDWVPVGLLLHRRAFPLSPCRLTAVFDLWTFDIGRSPLVHETALALADGWSGSLAELAGSARELAQ